MDSGIRELSEYRFQRAKEDLETAEENVQNGKYKASINRSYYAVFHSIRAVNALKMFDSRKHSGVIAYFNREFVKEGIFSKDASRIIDSMFRLREKADYDDFYVASRQQAEEQLEKAKTFLRMIEPYLNSQWEGSNVHT